MFLGLALYLVRSPKYNVQLQYDSLSWVELQSIYLDAVLLKLSKLSRGFMEQTHPSSVPISNMAPQAKHLTGPL